MVREGVVDDLDPFSVSGFGRLGRAGVDGGLTGLLQFEDFS